MKLPVIQAAIYKIDIYQSIQLQIRTLNEVTFVFSCIFLCLKIKMLNKEFGGTVMKKDIREDGQFKITVETSSALFRFVLLKKTTLIRKKAGFLNGVK